MLAEENVKANASTEKILFVILNNRFINIILKDKFESEHLRLAALLRAEISVLG